MALSRAQKKLAATRRAQRRLQQRLDDIDWELDDLAPEMEQLALREARKNVHVIDSEAVAALGAGNVQRN